jgi:hypothetical protein
VPLAVDASGGGGGGDNPQRFPLIALAGGGKAYQSGQVNLGKKGFLEKFGLDWAK